MKPKSILWLAAAFVALGIIGALLWRTPAVRRLVDPDGTYTIDIEDVQPSKPKYNLFTDDDPSGKNPTFIPDLVDSRLVSDRPENPWEINASAATIRLDVPDLIGDQDSNLRKLHPSYADAANAIGRERVIPSVNQLDGKAKQFDDGLYAELDAGLTAEKLRAYAETAGLVRGTMDKLDRTSSAYAWLWGALSVGGFLNEAHRAEPTGAAKFIADFNRSEVESKPIGFYTWSDDLKRTFRFLRYLMHGWNKRQGEPDQIAAVMAAAPDLLKQYQRMLDFYARLTNPYSQLSFLPLTDPANASKTLQQLWKEAGLELHPSPAWVPTAHFLPYSGSKEVRLFNRLFGVGGLPPEADLMLELVKAIRSGKVNLKPSEKSGWYDHQVYAMETFLLPERGPEGSKLVLTKKYKERMLQAFAALITKRRETHVRQLEKACAPKCEEKVAPPSSVILRPRLRVEPNPTFFLRTARAYAFLGNFLSATLPAETLKALRGRRQNGDRAMPLAEELAWMKSFFYGLHLISCEDIGMRSEILKDEPVDADACTKLANDWLEKWDTDQDLAIDTRASVPIFEDQMNRKTRLWATLGVRGAKLKAGYVKGPSWRPAKADAANREWQAIPAHQLAGADYIILVDEFAEIELNGIRVLTREELRKVCDREGTKEAIVNALK